MNGAENRNSLPEQRQQAGFWQLIRADWKHKREWLRRERGWKTWLYLLLCEGSLAHLIYRAMRFCQTHHLKAMAAVLYRLNAMFCKTIIGRDAQFGPGLVILHSFGIVVNSEVRSGERVVLEHMITIGAEAGQCPRLGSNIFIGAGAKIIGNVRVGNDVQIGANAVVVKDVPDGATVVGVPARVVKIYGQPVDRASSSIAEV